MRNIRRFTERVSKKSVNQVSYFRSYENKLPLFVYFLIGFGVLATLITIVIYCCSI